ARPVPGRSDTTDLAPAGEAGDVGNPARRIDEPDGCRSAAADDRKAMDCLRANLEALAARELDVDRQAADAAVSGAELRGRPRDDLVPAIPAEEAGGVAVRQGDGDEEPGAGRDLERCAQAGPDGAESARGREGTSAEIEPLPVEARGPAH